MYASFIAKSDVPIPSLAVMSLIEGEPSDSSHLRAPSAEMADAAFAEALRAAGLPGAAKLDTSPKDQLIRRVAKDIILVTRLDIMGRYDVETVDPAVLAQRPLMQQPLAYK
jgi:hypothetical protein